MEGKMSRVLLIGSEDEENLSIRYPAASLAACGHPIEIVPCSAPEEIPQVLSRVERFRPDIIALSLAFQCLAPVFFTLIDRIRTSGYRGHITVGGHFPTFEYRKILETQQGIDSVVRFEGEQALVELAEWHAGSRDMALVSNLVYRDGNTIRENACIRRFPVLDDLPFPVRNSRPHVRLGEHFATLVASRGCWHSACAYCCIGAFHAAKEGRRHAVRTPGGIAREISWLYHTQGIRLFQFHDDNFLLARTEENISRLEEIRAALEKEHVDTGSIAFLIKARPDSITSDTAEALKDLGVVGVFLGVENASATGLKALIRGSEIHDVHRAMEVLRERDMVVTYNLLIFHPDATLDEINENIWFVKDHPGYPFDFGRAEIVAGSPLERRVISAGLLRGEWPNWDYRIRDPEVERMFRINLATFRRQGSGYSQLTHTLIALAYRASMVQRLYPGPVAEKTGGETAALLGRSNRFVLEHILRMYALTADMKSENELDQLYGSIQLGCDRLKAEADRLSG
ncbi:MAG: B12-binding domain-containing radical SAM protein, partial [Methanomicrobiales archaeon]|nr:B12-binding domain-containing radical SAM protein [Methanomicrobiales archaeon]